ncbi:MAG TPA: hypothetical protein VMO47_01710 [Rhodothermales bacterium]|nr:hypothetical protein [Rhodothermales bacterium]
MITHRGDQGRHAVAMPLTGSENGAERREATLGYAVVAILSIVTNHDRRGTTDEK